jgi:cytochrome c-type biogenesis protein CcmF
LFINNIILVVALVVVLLGTLLPLVHKELGLGSISIGEPFFNNIFGYLFIPFSLVLGIAPLVRWKQDNIERNKGKLFIGIAFTLLIGLTSFLAYQIDNPWTLFGICLGVWIVSLTVMEVLQNKQILKLPLSHWGMVMGHLGFAVLIIGVAVTRFASVETDVRMQIGSQVVLSDYTFTLERIRVEQGPNYTAHIGDFSIQQGDDIYTLAAEKRFYTVQSSVMTESGIDPSLFRDLYVSLGEQLADGSWGVSLYVKPFIRWVWLGSIFMCIAALLCIRDKRYRNVLSARKPATT